MAARSINTVLRGEADEAAAFEEFEARYRREYSRFHDFLVAFYDMHQDENSYFWSAKKLTSNAGTELESFVELVGGGGWQEDALLAPGVKGGGRDAAMRQLADIVDQPVRAAGEDRNLLQASLARSVVREGSRLQVQAVMGGNVDEVRPIREGGLIPSADGMHWVRPDS